MRIVFTFLTTEYEVYKWFIRTQQASLVCKVFMVVYDCLADSRQLVKGCIDASSAQDSNAPFCCSKAPKNTRNTPDLKI
ncbi:hypothetical protein NQ318_023112, partial [Aromia moschata]